MSASARGHHGSSTVKVMAIAGILTIAAGCSALMAGGNGGSESRNSQAPATAELATFTPPSFDIETSPPVDSR